MSFPDFPGCITADKTLQEAQRNAVGALTLQIEEMREDGDTIPKPSPIDTPEKHPVGARAMLLLVDIPLDENTVRVNITAQQSRMDTIDRLAESLNDTFAYIVRTAMKEIKSAVLPLQILADHQLRFLALI